MGGGTITNSPSRTNSSKLGHWISWRPAAVSLTLCVPQSDGSEQIGQRSGDEGIVVQHILGKLAVELLMEQTSEALGAQLEVLLSGQCLAGQQGHVCAPPRDMKKPPVRGHDG